MTPFLKWAGGKRWLLKYIENRIPAHKTYYEPFLGGGALFFALEPKSAVLTDINFDLINCYRQVRNNCDLVVKVLRRLKIDENTYYRTRAKFNCEKDRVKKAAYFIYLNKTSWNGLYRVNGNGEFNVPYAKNFSKGFQVFDKDHLYQARKILRRATIKCCDFESSVSKLNRKSDFVYFDPPYITTHINNGFIKYNSVLFDSVAGLRLSKLADKLARRGVKIMLSNAAHPAIKKQFDGMFYKTEISRASFIAGNVESRGRFTELLVTSFPIEINHKDAPAVKKDLQARSKQYRPQFNPKCKL